MRATKWGTSAVRALLVAIAIAAAAWPSGAWAARSAAEVCGDVSKKAGRTLWSSVRESGDSLFCRKSWVPGSADELAACGLWTQTNLFGNKLKNAWNAHFAKDGGWATWGPRGISVDWEEGTIRGGFKRTYFGAGLAYSKTTVEVVKEDGQAEASVTACVLDYDGNLVSKEQKSFPSGKGGKNESVKFVLENKDNRIVGVVVDTPASVNSFEYRARMLSAPIRNDLPAVKGIADLHVHQAAALGFGGRMYWGQAAGPIETALAKEEISPGGTNFDLGSPEGLLKQLAQPGASLDANVLFTVFAGGAPQDDGIFRYGGEGYPSFKDWPHHADRSHQGVYLDWVKEAHERNKDSHSNLQLMVVSLVNNNILCSLAQVFDRYGNLPIRDAGGHVLGWESKSWGCSDHENVIRQLQSLHAIEKANKWYRIAMTPWHARQIIDDGDLAVVVSMETDKPLSSEGNNYGNWEDQLDFYRAMGLTSLQIAHESDSVFCGAALHRNEMEKLQAIHWPIKAVADLLKGGSAFAVDEQRYNKLGITEAGKKLVDAMVKRNMPVDLAHSSQRCRKGVMDRVGTDYALYDSHTKFKALLAGENLEREQEFLITESGVADYRKHKVLIGLRPAPIDVKDAPGSKVRNDCPGSARSYAQLVQFASDQGLSFAIGSDFNGGIAQLGPRFPGGAGRCYAARQDLKERDRIPPSRASKDEGPLPARARTVAPIAGTNYYQDGLATIGWEPELTVDLVENLRTPGAEKLRAGAEAFLEMWERAFPPEGTPASSVKLASTSGETPPDTSNSEAKCRSDADCGAGRWCDEGLDLSRNSCKAKLPSGAVCGNVGEAGVGHRCSSGECKVSGLSTHLECK